MDTSKDTSKRDAPESTPEVSDVSPLKKQKLSSVAYFCMEYGVSQAIQIYSGGLGILAGDIVKQIKDEALPITCIGIFWSHGYVTQKMDKGESVADDFPKISLDSLTPLKFEGDLSVEISKKKVKLMAYQVKEYPNLLLLEPIADADKKLTEKLYQGDRIAQEIILGVGGVRLLRKLKKHIDVYHFNEGHAAFAALELIREKMEEKKLDFKAAWEMTKKECAFTTHTPVKAGNESHALEDLIAKGASVNLTKEQLTEIGDDPFNMTVAGLRLSYLSNSVSALHGVTAREMWKDVENASKIVSVTNGVHVPSWQDESIRKTASGSDKGLWDAHQTLKKKLLTEIEKRTKVKLNPDALLVGFARRAVVYKRAQLIFRKEDEIKDLLNEGRVQLVFAGKAHPDDKSGKETVKELLEWQAKYPKAVVYVPNYDMILGAALTRGCDVWLNNPRRPLEASGTSGMKAAMNGVLNLSILDGWWPEGCVHGENGWKIGDEKTHEEGEEGDEEDATALAKVLKEEVLKTYEAGGGTKWIKMMKASISMSQDKFSAKRMMDDYYTLVYSAKPLK